MRVTTNRVMKSRMAVAGVTLLAVFVAVPLGARAISDYTAFADRESPSPSADNDLTLQAGEPSVPWQKTMGYQTSEVYPITIGKFGYPYVSVFVNGQKLDLGFDTANMSGLVFNSEIATRLGLPVVGDSKLYDSSGALIGTSRVFNVRELKAFGKVWTNVQAFELKTSDFAGLIGPRFVLGKRFTLDYRNKVIAISNSPLPSQALDGALLPLIEPPQLKGMILVRGAVNGRKVLMQIDTGKSRTCVDSSLVVLDKMPQSGDGYRLKEVKLGPYTFSVPSARQDSFKGISEGLPEPILLGIGSDILSQLILTVDYSREVMSVSR